MDRRLHIAVLDEELPFPLNSGKRIRTFHLLSRLAKRHRITYLCHRMSDPVEDRTAQAVMQDAGIRCVVVNAIVPPKSGIRFLTRLALNVMAKRPYSVVTHASSAMRRAMQKLLREDPPDLWHAEWTPYADLLRHPPHPTIPWLVMAHNVESLIWQRYAETESHSLKRWYIRRQWNKFIGFERWAYASAAMTITVSEEDAGLIRRDFNGRNVQVVDNGVDTTQLAPNPHIPRDPFRVLFLGSLDWRPNLDAVRLLLDSIFPTVYQAEPRARLIIVGRKPPAWLREKTRELPWVELNADVPDVRPYLHSAGLLAVPLRIGGGSRLKILEAMASGLPVVSTVVGAEGLHLEQHQHLLLTPGPDTFAAALLRGMQNKDQMQQYARNAREWMVTRYDWSRLSERLEHCWISLASNGHQRSFIDSVHSAEPRITLFRGIPAPATVSRITSIDPGTDIVAHVSKNVVNDEGS